MASSTPPPDAAPPAAAADASAPLPPVEQLNYGIREGEVNEMEQKWGDWADDVEENKRLVIDEVEHQVPLTPFAATPGRTFRPRRRNVVSQALVARAPVFYGWVVGGLAALAALLVSPVQVYCVGVVLDAMQFDLALSRMRISAIYAASLLSAAPFLLFKEKAAEVVSRQVLVGLCGVLFCGGCVLLTMVQGPTALLAVWTLMQVVGPGVLYPATESALVQWWRRRRAMVGAAVQSIGALLGMLVLPAILSAVACSPDGDAWCASEEWRGAYASIGAAFLVPALLLSLLLLEGGAVDHEVPFDGGVGGARDGLLARAAVAAAAAGTAPERGGDDGDDDGIEMHGAETARAPEAPSAAAAAAAAAGDAAADGDGEHVTIDLDGAPAAADAGGEASGGGDGEAAGRRERSRASATAWSELWGLHDVLTHTSFWLAQISISTVHAVVSAFLFHRKDLMEDVRIDPNQSLTLEVMVALACAVCAPAGLLIGRKEYMVIVALLVTGAACLILVHNHNAAGLTATAVLLGAAFGVTNAYSTTLWEYFYGTADAERIRQTSLAITTATSGSAIWVFALSREELPVYSYVDGVYASEGSYRTAMNTSAVVALVLAGCDLLLLAKPELLEAIVRRAPTWEQMLAARQRRSYNSYRASGVAALGSEVRAGWRAGGLAGAAKRLKDKLVAAREAPIFRAMESEEVQ